MGALLFTLRAGDGFTLISTLVYKDNKSITNRLDRLFGACKRTVVHIRALRHEAVALGRLPTAQATALLSGDETLLIADLEHGTCVELLCKLYARRPVDTWKIRIVPSPHPAASRLSFFVENSGGARHKHTVCQRKKKRAKQRNRSSCRCEERR